ncbi:MAG: iron-sulfur cluster assembly protein, partial [Rhodospirillales bacterium]
MPQVTQQKILDALAQVRDNGRDIVGQNMVSGLRVKDGHVSFAIEVDPQRGPHLEPLRKEAEEAVLAVDGVTAASVVLTAESKSAANGPGPGSGEDGEKPMMPGVKSIIAIASG